MRLAAFLAFALILAGPAAGQNAIADILSVFDGTGDDLSNVLLSRIFGCKLFPGVANCDILPAPAFTAVIGLFNYFAIALGMALFTWNLTAGTMQTAHEGKVLGSNWSSLWAPIRTVTAVAMLSPLPAADNYNAVQMSIGWLVRSSTSAASIVWARGSSVILNHQAPITSPEIVFDQELMKAAWEIASCQAVLEHVNNSFAEEGRLASLQPAYRETVPPNDIAVETIYRIRREFGTVDSAGSGLDVPFETCGTMSLPAPPQVVLQAGQASRWYTAHRDAVQAMIDRVRPAARALLDETQAQPGQARSPGVVNAAAAIRAGSDGYHAILSRSLPDIAATSAIAVSISGTSDLSAAARRRIDLIIGGAYSETCSGRDGQQAEAALDWICDQGGAGQGWLGAGAWYMHMARFANEASSLYNARPEIVDPPDFGEVIDRARSTVVRDSLPTRAFFYSVEVLLGLDYGYYTPDRRERLAGLELVLEEAAQVEKQLDNQWNAAVILAAQSGARVDGRLIQGAFETEGVNPHMADWWEEGRSWLARKARDWFLPSASVDPMAALAEFGNAQLAWGLGLAGVGGIAQTGLSNILPLSQIVKELGNMGFIIGIALLTTGSFLAFILPLMPFLLWTAAVTGYFILIAEAIIAVNLWGIAHLRMDGQSFAGEAARQGYYLVLALALSPILMVLGFVLSMAIFKVTSVLVGIGFDVAIRGIAHDQSWVVWFVGMTVVGIMMVVVYVVLAERSFSLTAELPSRILRWVGANAELGSKEDDRIRASALAAAGVITKTGQDMIHARKDRGNPGRARPGADNSANQGGGG